MKLLVTGGCGFIGSNFLHHWRRQFPQDALLNVDLLTYAGNPANVADLAKQPRYEFVKADIADPAAMEKAFRGVDVVVHFAAESHVDRSIRDARAFLHTNVIGTQVLLEAARKADVKRFHHVSTDEVFGHLPLDSKAKFTEETPYAPRSPYAASKAAADHLVRAWGTTYGLPYTITNGSNNYGPYQFPEKVIPRFITRLIQGKRLPVYGKGANVRDWLHVEDYCAAIRLVLQKGRPGQTYLVGGGEELDNKTLALRVAKAFGKGADAIEYVTDRPGHDLRYALDSSKIKKELGWKPQRAFPEGLKETIEWYKSHETWWRTLAARAEAQYA